MDNSNLNKEIQDNENVVDNNVNSNNDVNSNVNPMVSNSLDTNVNNTLNANTEVASSIESNEVKASSSEITPLKEVEEVKVNQENKNVNKDIEPENNEKVNQTSDKKINGFEISLIIIIILLIVVIGIILYKMYFADKKEDNKNNTNDNENGEVAKPSEEEYTLNVYKSESGSLCSEKSDYCSNVAYTIKTETEDAKMITSDASGLFILYKDNVLKIYDVKSDSIKKTEVPTDGSTYNIVTGNNKLAGIIVRNNSSSELDYEYYNIENNKKMYAGKYEYLGFINENYLVGIKDGRRVLLSANEEKEATNFIEDTEFDNDNMDFGYLNRKVDYKDKSFYVLVNSGPDGDLPIAIYDNNKKFITSYLNEVGYDIVDNYLYVSVDNAIKKYDIDGNLLKTLDSTKEKKFEQIIENYVVYLKNDNTLSLMNIDTKEEKNIDKLKDGDYVDIYTTDYYSRDKLDSMNEKDKAAGIYVVIYYKEKDASGNYGMEYCYTDNGEIKTYPIEHEMGGRAKPVLYLYSTEKTNIKVEFEHPEYLTTTYPKYTNSWNVTAYPNGDLYDENNKYYYALYWDETRYHEVDFKEGFYVTKENAISFLEEKLDIIGLNKKEKNEFIMYWLPILERNEKNLVYFELTEEREATNKLIITPKPDALLRVSIHIKKVDKEIEIKEQHLEKFKRDGFVAVEWGGMTY